MSPSMNLLKYKRSHHKSTRMSYFTYALITLVAVFVLKS